MELSVNMSNGTASEAHNYCSVFVTLTRVLFVNLNGIKQQDVHIAMPCKQNVCILAYS